MPEPVPSEKPAEESPADDQQAAGGTPPAEGAEVPGDGAASTEVEGSEAEAELPDWVRKTLEKARNDAGRYRTQLRDAQSALEAAKTPEEFAAATATLSEKVADLETQLARERVVRKYELPDDLAVLLKDMPTEELDAVAKTLQKYAPATDSVVLGGGLSPDDGDDGEMDPRKLARRTRR